MANQPGSKKAAIRVFVIAQIFIVGLLLVVFTGSGDRAGRVKTTIAVADTEKIQNAVASYYEERKILPADSNALRLQSKQGKPYFTAEELGTQPYTFNIADGVIILTFSADQETLSGKTLIFIPQVSGGKLDWSCNTGSVDMAYRPSQCGGKQTT